MDRYAVLGNPVTHSLSPRIHALFAEQTGEPISYLALEAPLDQFSQFVAGLHQEGYQGMNVTLPFKEEAWQLSESRSKRAERAGAVNTLIRTATGYKGDNTDGAGLVSDLTRNLNITLQNRDILILGAGGAVRGVLQPLLAASPKSLHIGNRTAERARQLATDFSPLGPVSASGLDGPYPGQYDLIINGTAASIQGRIPSLPDGLLREGGVCYDMMYSPSGETAFVQWGREQGAAVSSDGLGMLVEQAAESFYLWRDIRPGTRAVLETLRDNLSAS